MSKLARTTEALGRLPESLRRNPEPAKKRTRAANRQRGTWPARTKITIDLRGATPVAKGSMRGFIAAGRAIVTDTKTAELRAFERDVRQMITREMDRRELPCAQNQPFELLILFYLPRPGGDFDKHGGVKAGARCEPWTKPDLDKLERATLDALTGIAYDDDARVCRVVKEKRYSTADRDVGMWFELRVRPSTMRERAALAQTTLGDAR